MDPARQDEGEPRAVAERRYRVLVVDDDPTARQAFAQLLDPEFEVETVDSGALALARLEQGEFELLLADHAMPGMTGVELFRTVQLRGWPVGCVICTGDTRRIPPALSSGADPGLVAVVEKPAAAPRLIRLLRQVGKLVDLRRALQAVRET